MYEGLQEFAQGKTAEVQELLQPVMDWAIAASCKSAQPSSSQMAYGFPTVTMASADLTKEVKHQLDRTLGAQPVREPTL